jgi:hypothetical protein
VPYAPVLCEFLNDLSSELRSTKEASNYPDIMTFAFWCRKSNLRKLKENFTDGLTRIGRGLAFHVTPSNVPINFAFSFAFGLLSGNANVVRIPSKPFPQTDIICGAINSLFERKKKYCEIKAMTTFIKYEQNDKITGALSANCDARIIWGGNLTIKNIRSLPIPERAVEIVFADRYSVCIIDSPSIMKLNGVKLLRLAEYFYNDTYLMDQNACSSPHLIVWQGEKKELAKEKFWNAISRTVSEKYQLEFVQVIDKYTLLCHDAIELNNISSFKRYENNVYQITLNHLPNDADTLRGKFGYFYEYDIEDINNITHIINSKYQTLTYFGVDKFQITNFVIKNCLSGIDRIVPIGQALDISDIWDGYDLVKSLSRIIDVK